MLNPIHTIAIANVVKLMWLLWFKIIIVHIVSRLHELWSLVCECSAKYNNHSFFSCASGVWDTIITSNNDQVYRHWRNQSSSFFCIRFFSFFLRFHAITHSVCLKYLLSVFLDFLVKPKTLFIYLYYRVCVFCFHWRSKSISTEP